MLGAPFQGHQNYVTPPRNISHGVGLLSGLPQDYVADDARTCHTRYLTLQSIY
jgi:hypothetical protein